MAIIKKFLLSNGTTTTDSVSYIKDLLKVHLYIRPNEVPYWTGGSEDIIEVYEESKLARSIGSIIENVVDNINQSTGSNLEVIDIKVRYDQIDVNLKLNDLEIPYVIKRSN